MAATCHHRCFGSNNGHCLHSHNFSSTISTQSFHLPNAIRQSSITAKNYEIKYLKLHYVSAAHSQVSNNGQPLSQTQPSPFLSLFPVLLFLRPFKSRITPSRSDSIQSARGSGIVTQLGHAPQRCVPSPSATGRLGNSGKEGRGAARQRQRFQAASRQTKRRPNQPKTSRGGRTDLTWAVAGGQQAKLVTTTQWPEDDFTPGLREL